MEHDIDYAMNPRKPLLEIYNDLKAISRTDSSIPGMIAGIGLAAKVGFNLSTGNGFLAQRAYDNSELIDLLNTPRYVDVYNKYGVPNPFIS